MKHYSLEEWTDFVRGVTDEGTRAILMDNDQQAIAAALEMSFMEEFDAYQVHAPTFLYAGEDERFVKQAAARVNRDGRI